MIFQSGSRRWSLESADPAVIEEIAGSAGVSRTTAHVLAVREFKTGAAAVRLLNPGVGWLPDAHLLPDADRVVERVGRALDEGERIVVHGHDDADGVTAAVIMVEALLRLGATVDSYIPDRRTEGHGLNRAELDRFAARGVTLVITVDSCISDRDDIAYGNSLGIDTIVTDHHEIPPELPPAVAIVNAKLPGIDYPYRYLAGVGVAWRISELLLEELSGRCGGGEAAWYGSAWDDEALALVAIGSIADRVPLTGDNRDMVVDGLKAAARSERPGLKALLAETGLAGGEVTHNDVREFLGPIFGRVSNGEGVNAAYDLLVADYDEAEKIARELALDRKEWQQSAAAAWKKVKALVPKDSESVLVIETDIPIEVMGAVTSRLAEQSGSPVILIRKKNSDATAEARGPVGYNIVEAFRSMSELLLNYGGHPRAAGFSIASAKIPLFRERMLKYAAATPPVPVPRQIDAELGFAGITTSIAGEMDALGPFGQGWSRPALLARGVTDGVAEAARHAGIRFSTQVPRMRRPVDLVYRLRLSDGIAFVNILDTVVARVDASAGARAGDMLAGDT
jgi:single-stranded-DNA-specific exonuclease